MRPHKQGAPPSAIENPLAFMEGPRGISSRILGRGLSAIDDLRSGIIAFRRQGDAPSLPPVAHFALGGITQCEAEQLQF